MSTPFTVVPESLNTLAGNIDSQVVSLLEQAKEKIEAAEIEGGKFSRDGLAMQLAYPGTHEFVLHDLDSKIEALKGVSEQLKKIAESYEKADDSSRVKVGG